MYFKMQKPSTLIPDYMTACMDGASHPLNIETDEYVMTPIGRGTTDLIRSPAFPGDDESQLNAKEEEFIQLFKDRPDIEWAIQNSFDGLYIKKMINHYDFSVTFQFAVYMKAENKTFWKLKYS